MVGVDVADGGGVCLFRVLLIGHIRLMEDVREVGHRFGEFDAGGVIVIVDGFGVEAVSKCTRLVFDLSAILVRLIEESLECGVRLIALFFEVQVRLFVGLGACDAYERGVGEDIVGEWMAGVLCVDGGVLDLAPELFNSIFWVPIIDERFLVCCARSWIRLAPLVDGGGEYLAERGIGNSDHDVSEDFFV